ncbi:hypothetical protein H2201_005530 [Coniosporium apollinis]|uniref:Uncharacterized protein n=2 Tax=Coniosporium TaxID=2810619 RepID=A0ABQ9NPK3_9PEZI|nr:hypothetical protein H2199_003028 [Cladosporium sp. JES 115]KAJ9663569.1 hypothetical protein H2201_005530 [Coniosporium apollinis]
MGAVQPAADQAAQDVVSLFEAVEAKFPSKTVGDDKWYLVTLTTLVGGGMPELAADLYSYLIQKPGFSTPESRQALMRRLREALVKCVPIIGVCKPLEAVFSIDKIQRPEDKDYSFSREGWQCDERNHARGAAWQDRIYLHNQANIDELLAAQKDFAWISREITYGLYLSDHTILNDVDTELVVLSGIMIQNLRRREQSWVMAEPATPPQTDLRSKTVIVTGGANGIGAQAVREYYNRGANVVIADLPNVREAAETLISSFAEPARALFIPANIAVWDDMKRLFKATVERFGRVHIVIANAAIMESKSFYDMEVDENGELKEPTESYRVIDVNLKGTMNSNVAPARGETDADDC